MFWVYIFIDYCVCFLQLPDEVHYFYPHFTGEESEVLSNEVTSGSGRWLKPEFEPEWSSSRTHILNLLCGAVGDASLDCYAKKLRLCSAGIGEPCTVLGPNT